MRCYRIHLPTGRMKDDKTVIQRSRIHLKTKYLQWFLYWSNRTLMVSVGAQNGSESHPFSSTFLAFRFWICSQSDLPEMMGQSFVHIENTNVVVGTVCAACVVRHFYHTS